MVADLAMAEFPLAPYSGGGQGEGLACAQRAREYVQTPHPYPLPEYGARGESVRASWLRGRRRRRELVLRFSSAERTLVRFRPRLLQGLDALAQRSDRRALTLLAVDRVDGALRLIA